MDVNKEMIRPEVKERRRNRLVESLASLRTEEKADVYIIAGEKQLFAHKIVLEASSPFFATAIEESEDGKITFEDVDPDTVEIVLDFLYLGDLINLTEVSEIRKVMDASIKMDMHELFEYCVAILIEMLNNENFVEIWEAAVNYQHKEMIKKVHFYLFNHADELINTEQFLQSSFEQIVELVKYTMKRIPCFDKMFLAMVSWIRHDFGEREVHAKELFALVSPSHLSRQFLKAMLEDEELMSCNEELFNCMNKLGVDVFVFSSPGFCPEGRAAALPPTLHFKNVKITYFCEYKIEEFYDGSTNRITRKYKPYCLMQQLDLHSMTWHLPKKTCLTSIKGTSTAQCGRHIYFVGGSLDSVYAIFDNETNTIELIGCKTFNGRLDSGLCMFRDFLFLIGGRNADGVLASCFKVFPGSASWTEVATLKYARGNPQVGATSDYIYVIGGGPQHDRSTRVIEYLYESDDQLEQGTINIRNIPRSLPVYFIVSGEVLFGFYVYNNELIRIWYDHTTSYWNAKGYPSGPPTITGINQVTSLPERKSLMFVSTTTKGFRLPTHVWQPDTGIWIKLAPVKGKCVLPEMEQLPYLYTTGI